MVSFSSWCLARKAPDWRFRTTFSFIGKPHVLFAMPLYMLNQQFRIDNCSSQFFSHRYIKVGITEVGLRFLCHWEKMAHLQRLSI